MLSTECVRALWAVLDEGKARSVDLLNLEIILKSYIHPINTVQKVDPHYTTEIIECSNNMVLIKQSFNKTSLFTFLT